MCGKSEIHLCINVSKDLKLLNWTYCFKSKIKGNQSMKTIEMIKKEGQV
jgi:hypothetical protein